MDIQRLSLKTTNLAVKRIEKLKKLFPEVFTEGKIDFEKLRASLGEFIEEKSERYYFAWAGKTESIRNLQVSSCATLVPFPGESIDFDNASHIFIEGDNLEVMKLLLKSYYGRIKVIYIDPPYNTGNDFIYRDDYRDTLQAYLKQTKQIDENGDYVTSNPETSGRYHSAWLSMMYPRLFLARQLLREDGLIFISIDDTEVHHLRLLLNEIFGEENFVQQLVWQRHAGGGNDSKYFAVDHEYILCAAKNKKAISKLRRPLTEKERQEYTGRDEYYHILGPYKTKSFRRMRSDDPRPGLRYVIEAPDGTPLYDEWKWEKSKFEKAYRENKVIIRRGRNGNWQVEYKIYLYDTDEDEEPTKVPRSLLIDMERNSDGRRQLRAVLGQDNLFSNPKPVGLIKHLIQIASDKDAIVLDFFAGSGTTGQAVLELNAEDGGHRQFILVQLPEQTPEDSPARKAGFKTISDICKERIRRVIMGYGDNPQPLKGVGFKVFKLAPSNFKQWEDYTGNNPDEYLEQLSLFQKTLVDGYRDIDVIYEVILKEGYDLNSRIERVENVTANTVFRVTDPVRNQSFYICLDEKVYLEALEPLALKEDDLFICLDTALDDTAKANLALQCRLKTI